MERHVLHVVLLYLSEAPRYVVSHQSFVFVLYDREITALHKTFRIETVAPLSLFFACKYICRNSVD